MNSYYIQAKLNTMLEIHLSEEGLEHGFRFEDFSFRTSKYDGASGRGDGTWIISKTLEAESSQQAITMFSEELVGIWSRIQFVGQAYCEHLAHATLLVQRKNGADGLALLIHVKERGATGLAFTEGSKQALEALCSDESVDDSFYYYLAAAAQSNDLTNKMMTVFAALESLFKKREKGNESFFRDLEAVFGKELKEKYWDRGESLRHRLMHGNYFNDQDSDLSYQNDVHRRLMRHFNESVIGEKLIHEDVVNPQRTPWQNKVRQATFVERVNERGGFISINDVLDELDVTPGSYDFCDGSQFRWADEPSEETF